MLIDEKLLGAFKTSLELIKKNDSYAFNHVELKVAPPKPGVDSAKFGEWSCPTPLEMNLTMDGKKMSPLDTAQLIIDNLPPLPEVERFEAVKPGFINIFLSTEFYENELQTILKEKNKYGDIKQNTPEKIQVEYISANPTGPLTLGNARGGYLGDTISRVLSKAGHDVTKEYYFNDAGTQISKLIESVKISAGLIEGEQTYRGVYIDELAVDFKKELDSSSDSEVGAILTKAIFDRHIKEPIKRMGIEYDVWFNEGDLIKSGEFDLALTKLKENHLVYESEGATWLKTTELGDDRDRVIIKGTGDNTYLANDVPYHLNIFEKRGFDKAIKILGADHSGQIISLGKIIDKLLPEKKLEFIIVQWVRLMQGGQEVKMGKRLGTYVTVGELIDEVGPDVARFFFLMRSPESQMLFDLDLAKEQSQKNPVFYVQYAYARIAGILAKSKVENEKLKVKVIIEKLVTKEEKELIRLLSRFPMYVERLAQNYQVHMLTTYATELAAAFHLFYDRNRVIQDDKELMHARLALLEATKIVFKNTLDLIGVSTPEEMRREELT